MKLLLVSLLVLALTWCCVSTLEKILEREYPRLVRSAELLCQRTASGWYIYDPDEWYHENIMNLYEGDYQYNRNCIVRVRSSYLRLP
jgi:hypothetical protein